MRRFTVLFGIFRNRAWFIIFNILGFYAVTPCCKYGTQVEKYKVMAVTKSADSLKPIAGLYVQAEIDGISDSRSTDAEGKCQLQFFLNEGYGNTIKFKVRDVDSTVNGAYKNLDTTINIPDFGNTVYLKINKK